ncbi:hypothetical protein PoB_005586300 [Plakobranchus ocellatus]|uniref:Uncharacterized protein n=1 Tax=Plakobranchus ocellatus TaxID=259542 RepID=A0AAV4CD53_9GAST|nr:hypothetical protein PoB_005586300 [Plakobranchus ocellatus]
MHSGPGSYVTRPCLARLPRPMKAYSRPRQSRAGAGCPRTLGVVSHDKPRRLQCGPTLTVAVEPNCTLVECLCDWHISRLTCVQAREQPHSRSGNFPYPPPEKHFGRGTG